jgi:hypothetical protein
VALRIIGPMLPFQMLLLTLLTGSQLGASGWKRRN